MIQRWIRRFLGRVAQWMVSLEHKQMVYDTKGHMQPLDPTHDYIVRKVPISQFPMMHSTSLPKSCQRGEHDWRYIASPYVRQCKVKACGSVAFSGDVPDGLKEYMDEMTSLRSVTQAHVDVLNATGGLHVDTSVDLGPFNDPLFGEQENVEDHHADGSDSNHH